MFLSLIAMMFVALNFVGCSKDDDQEPESKCRECSTLGVTASYCDNGDGTVNVTIAGQTTKTELEGGQSFSDFIASIDSNPLGSCKD